MVEAAGSSSGLAQKLLESIADFQGFLAVESRGLYLKAIAQEMNPPAIGLSTAKVPSR